ncbi:NADPH-dependent FMN reductase [Nitrosopumilus sp. b1]|uniref:NADPH-dependent FMN reductase n=1 Tax=Nitrosopumilus sp. b1 TaxID=2109907 RepID=UPI0015F687BB|nr:NAD(P)H-dependent oxidoreductase [Nitrosopumilus sp. b1]KAF6242085.1 NADPH-dependent FMN reductase [Nitrosopumilus sp. b1]
MSLNVLGVASSMRNVSYSTKILQDALDSAKQHGAETRLLSLKDTKLPLYSPEGISSPELDKVTDDVKWADAYILASPDYHGSMSGTMKNFLDYFWTEFAGKTFGYVCASHEKGLTVMDQMRTAVRQCYGWSMPYGVSVNSDLDFDSNGNPSEQVKSRIKTLGRDIAAYGKVISKQFKDDVTGNDTDTFAARYR